MIMRFQERLAPKGPALVLLVGLAVSLTAGKLVYNSRIQQANQEFSTYSDEIRLKTVALLDAHKQVLLGGAALFDASDDVNRQDWQRYAERLRLDEHFKGILGFGFSQKIEPGQLDAHILQMRQKGHAEYQVWPPGKRELYTSIVYLEPFSGRNLRAFGYDMYSEPVRRHAMARAMFDNQPVLSGKVHLVQETTKDIQAGTLMYVPVYRRSAPIATLQQRQQALLGWVYSPFRMKDLIEGTLFSTRDIQAEEVRFRIYDSGVEDESALLYDSGLQADVTDSSTVEIARNLDFNGTMWSLRFDFPATHVLAYARTSAISTCLLGALLTTLLFFLIRSIQNTQKQARRIADELTVELKEKRDALAVSEERLNYALAATGEGLWDWDIPNGRVTHNAKWSELLGIIPATLESDFNLFSKHLHDEDREHVVQRLTDHLERGIPYVSEHRMHKSNGEVIWVLDRGELVKRDESGNPLRMVGSIADVTARKQAQEALAVSEENLRRILSSSPEGVLALSLTQKITFCNDRLIDIFALQRNPEGTLSIDDFIEGMGSQVEPNQTRALRQTLDSNSEEVILRLRNPKRVIRCESKLLNSDELHTVIFFRDITREAEIDEMKSDFLATAAHELRAPMSSIFGFVELLLTRKVSDSSSKEYLQIVYDQTQSLIRLVNELLDLTRIEARAGRDFHLQSLQTANVLRKALHELNIPQDTHPVRFVSGEIGMPDVRIDEDKIKQVFVNVLGNAWKYSPEGGEIEIRQRLEQSNAGETLAVSITDHGIGMSAEQQQKAFDRFFRADTSGAIPGTGLGLSIVKEIMQIHGGSVSLTSRPGKGTTFTLHFPLETSETKGNP